MPSPTTHLTLFLLQCLVEYIMKQSHLYVLIATILSLALSIYLFFFMDHYDAKLYGIYVGLWVPSILGAFRVIETGRVEKEDGTD